MYASDEFRSSDHDPIIVGLALSSCPAVLNLTGTTSAAQYLAGVEIISDALVPTQSNVSYSAGMQICMNMDFEVELGAAFEAVIVGCN